MAMMAACIVGLDFISKANFMPQADSKEGDGTMDSSESVSEGVPMRGRKPGTIMTTKVRVSESLGFLVRAKIWWRGSEH